MNVLPSDEILVTLEPPHHVLLQFGAQKIRLSIPQFEQLFRGTLDATARIFHHHFQDTGERIPIGESMPAIRCDHMTAGADLGAVNIAATIHVGPLPLRFVVPRDEAVGFCQEVMGLLTAEHQRNGNQTAQ